MLNRLLLTYLAGADMMRCSHSHLQQTGDGDTRCRCDGDGEGEGGDDNASLVVVVGEGGGLNEFTVKRVTCQASHMSNVERWIS